MSDLGDPADGCGPPWAGRGLRLQHPPTPENGSAHAQTFVDAVSNIDGVNLDYSDASLEWVDGKLDHWRPEGSDVMAETVFVAGCYIGEVFVRNHGYRWVLTDVYGAMPVVEGPNGNFANPIGKAFKRVDNGEGDYLPYFLSVILANER